MRVVCVHVCDVCMASVRTHVKCMRVRVRLRVCRGHVCVCGVVCARVRVCAGMCVPCVWCARVHVQYVARVAHVCMWVVWACV